jgi:hypothetical protein
VSKKNHAPIQNRNAGNPGVASRVKASAARCFRPRMRTIRVSRNAVRRQSLPGKGSVLVANSPGMKNIKQRCTIRVATSLAAKTLGVPMESARVVNPIVAMATVVR